MFELLADRILIVALMLRPSVAVVCRLRRYVLWLNGAS